MESVKRDKSGEEVPLTDRYKQMISHLRDGAGRIIECLHDLLQMLGQADPNETTSSNLPVVEGISNGDRVAWTRMARLLIDAMTRVRDRNWDTSRWEDDVQLLNEPFGSDWDLDLWSALHELKIQFGLASGAYRPVYTWGIFFARNEATWPAQGPDPREQIEVFHIIDTYQHELTGLRNEIISIDRSRTPTSTTIFEFLLDVAKSSVPGNRGGGKPPGKK